MLLVVMASRGSECQELESVTLAGRADIPLATPAGEVTAASLVGEPTVIVFWATWCGTCRDELPDLARLSRDGHRVLAVGREALPRLRRFVDSRALAVPVARDTTGRLSSLFAIEVLPTTVVVDASGRAIEVHRGSVAPAHILATLARAHR